MTIPPDERRSPASLSTSTRIRSWSMRMGVFSVMASVGSAGDPADEGEQDHGAHHTADHLKDVLGPRLTREPVDEEALHLRDLAAHDGAGARAVDQLVDRAGEPLAGLLDLARELRGTVHLLAFGHVPEAINRTAPAGATVSHLWSPWELRRVSRTPARTSRRR